MYIIDKKIKQYVCSYIRHRYGVSLIPNRIYVFKYNYLGIIYPIYTITKYKDYITDSFPDNIDANEVDKWGIVLSRKEKINKIRKNGSLQGII